MSIKDKISYKIYTNKNIEKRILGIKKSFDNVEKIVKNMNNKKTKNRF